MSFVHLHTHSEYSMLDSLARVGDLFDLTSAQGEPAIAITDHGTLGGMWQAKLAADRTGVKLAPGLEGYLAIGSRYDRDKIEVLADDSASEGDDEKDKGTSSGGLRFKKRVYEHLTIIAINRAGWTNLVQIQNESSKHIAGRAKLIDYDLLKQRSEGLIVLTGCVGGPVFGPIARAEQMRQILIEDHLSDADDPTEIVAAAVRYAEARTAVEFAKQSDGLDAAAELDIAEEAQAAERELRARLRAGDDPLIVSELATRIIAEQQRGRRNVEKLIKCVGRENVYVEVMEHGNAPEQAALPHMRALAEEFGLPLVATNDCHYTHAHQHSAHDAWLAVQTKSTLATQKYHFHGSGYHLRTEAEMLALKPEAWWAEACANTAKVAERIEANIIPDPVQLLPQFPIPEGFEHENLFLKHLIQEGIDTKLGGVLVEEYRQRINSELDVIIGKGFVSYFLIVWDFINWARQNGIYIGYGRGSGAGSLVAYLLDITRVEPVEYDLLFERFLDPGRTELPDFDIDVESRYRGKLISYLGRKWGASNVAQIGTVGKSQVRASWKAALKVLGASPSLGDKTGKLIPQDLEMDGLLTSRQDPRLAEFWQETDKIEYADKALELAAAFYQVAQLSSIHAGGVIIAPVNLETLIPMRWAETSKGSGEYRWVTEWDYPDCESAGLVKFDLLGIRNLDMSHVAIDSIRDRLGLGITFENIPHPDHERRDPRVERTYEMLKQGHTEGVFQLESHAMTKLLEDVSPENLEELSAVIALFRPGPLSAGMHVQFADRKHGREPVSYDYLTRDPVEAQWLDTVMGKTYGVFVFQEQLMQLGRIVAGFDDNWRSKLRKAVSKKKDDLMAEVGAKLIEGGTREFRDEKGEVYSPVFAESTVQNLWEAMKGAASYLFNASHSIAYAYLAYITAYLKANFPGDYGAATLTVTGGDKADKRVAAMHALVGQGIDILPPDVNLSAAITKPEDDASVRIGLFEVKGFGAAAYDLIAERDAHGPFTSLDDLLTRVRVGDDARTMSTAQLDALVDSGALDAFGPRMGLTMVIRAGDSSDLEIPPIEYSAIELGVRQSDRLLMTLDRQVREEVQHTLMGWKRPTPGQFRDEEALPVGQLDKSGLNDGAYVYLSGILTSYSEKPYSKGVMGRISIQDVDGQIDGVIWEEQRARAKESGDIPEPGFPVVIYGRLETRTFSVGHSTGDDDSDSDDNEITRRQISIQSIYPINVSLDPRILRPSGELKRVVLLPEADDSDEDSAAESTTDEETSEPSRPVSEPAEAVVDAVIQGSEESDRAGTSTSSPTAIPNAELDDISHLPTTHGLEQDGEEDDRPMVFAEVIPETRSGFDLPPIMHVVPGEPSSPTPAQSDGAQPQEPSADLAKSGMSWLVGGIA